METSNTEKTTQVKEAKSSVDSYKANYNAAYDKLGKAVVSLNEDFNKTVAESKENLRKSQADIDRFHKQNDADIVAANKALTEEEVEVAKAVSVVKETFARETKEIEAAKQAALAASKERKANNAAVEKKAKEIAEQKRIEKANVAAAANRDIANNYDAQLGSEKGRNIEVIARRTSTNKNNEDEYASIVADLKSVYDHDIKALNDKIEAAQTKYFETLEAKTKAYKASCASKKAACDAKIAEYTEQSKSSEKATMKAGLKGIRVTQKAYDKDAKVSKAAFEADIAALKAEFVASVPPMEHTIFLRNNRYRIDSLAAKHKNAKTVDNSAYEEFVEKETNVYNEQTVNANHDIALAEQKHVEFCDAADNKMDVALADFATETFNAEEEYRLSEMNFINGRDNKRAAIKQSKDIQANEHRKKLATIENKYAKLNSEADTRYKQLVSELTALFTSFTGYYATLNKFDGTSAISLATIAGNFETACGDLAMSEEKAYSLFDTIVSVYNNDCVKQETGVLDEKIAKVKLCEKNTLDFAQKRYDYEKATLKANYDSEIAAENADDANKNAALDRELSDYENTTLANIASAKKLMDKTIADINARIAAYKDNDVKARANSESKKNEFIKNTNAHLAKLAEEKKARENAKLADNKNKAAELDAELEALKFSINQEKKGENAKHEKLTKKTIKALLKGCDIKPGTRWWIVDFNKKK